MEDLYTATGTITRICEKENARGPYLGITMTQTDGTLGAAGGIKVWFSQPAERMVYSADVAVGFGDLEKQVAFFEGDTVTVTAPLDKATSDPGIIFLKYVKVQGLDDLETPAETSSPASQAAPVTVPQGIYTVVFEDGSHRTLRLDVVPDEGQADQFAGWAFAKYLAGPNNEDDYIRFAYRRAGEAEFQTKKGFRDDGKIMAALHTVLGAGAAQLHEMGVAYARASGNCYICNRTLTEPTSIERGIGPICAAKVGL